MNKNIPFVISTVVLIGISGFLAYVSQQSEALEPVGVWRSVDEPYYIVFEGSTYRESEYNISRPFEEVAGGVMLYNIAGEPYFVELSKSIKASAIVNLNGDIHVMRKATEEEAINPLMYQWDENIDGDCVVAYTLKQDLDTPYSLRLYSDGKFESVLGDKTTIGKYVRSSDGILFLMTNNGANSDALYYWERGAAFGKIKSGVSVSEQRLNPIELLGYLLDGNIVDDESGVQYSFSSDSMCTRIQQDGSKTEFRYFMDTDGVITLTDAAGSGTVDYLWYDINTGTAFRYVLGVDQWYTYLNGSEIPDTFVPSSDSEQSNTSSSYTLDKSAHIDTEGVQEGETIN